MSDSLEVSFPGGKRVDVQVGKHRVQTDQSVARGGADSAPAPFEFFLASIASCAGIFALEFCQVRKIDTAGLALSMHWDGDLKHPERSSARIELRLPEGFPERYRAGIVRAMEQCAVKRQLAAEPRFETTVVD